MATESRRIADGSILVGLVRTAAIRLRVWVAASWFASAAKSLASSLETATATSRFAGSLRLLATWVRESFVYRWLTNEPDPEEITIDLRETYTVGPFVALVDRAAPRFERWWDGSALNRALDRIATILRGAPIRALSVVLSVAVLTNLSLIAATGTPSTTSILVRVLVLAFALAGTRVRTPWPRLARARTVQLLAAALEPPEPPEEERRE